jgi:hypothetical protein
MSPASYDARSRHFFVACGALAALLTLGACSSSSAKGGGAGNGARGCPKTCSADPAYTASDQADCEANTGDAACGAQARALYACIDANLVCTGAGTTDDGALEAACGNAKGAWEACQTADAGLE